MNKKNPQKNNSPLLKKKSKTRESEIFILEKCFEVFHESWNSSSYVLENVKVYKVFHMKKLRKSCVPNQVVRKQILNIKISSYHQIFILYSLELTFHTPPVEPRTSRIYI